MKKPKDLVLACHVYVDDGWYGEKYRYILSPEEGKGFTSKTAANKYLVRLRKSVQAMFEYNDRAGKLTNDHIRCGERDSFEEYIYCGSGPSNYHRHIHLTVADL